MKIYKFRAENFQKLKVVEIIPDGNVIKITGMCEQGKTTILDAIHAALGGGTMPEEPIRTGERKASITIDLGEMIVTRTFTPSGSTLKIENKEGFKASKPQDLLDKIVGKLAFDPLEFARADSKKQVEMLLSVVDLNVDMAHLQEISGVNIPVEGSPLDKLNKYYSEVMENRKLTNRQLDSAKKVLADMPELEKVEAVSVVDLIAEKEKLEKVNKDNAIRIAGYQGQENDLNTLQGEKIAISNTIKDLETKLEIERKNFESKDIEITAQIRVMEIAKAVIDSKQDKDLTEINLKISTADTTNKNAQKYIDREAKQTEVNKYQLESDNYTAKLKKIADYKTEIVSKTKFPIPGLDFANGGVTYDKLPFKQASGSQTLKVSTAIGMALNPRLRVMLIDGAESLDSKQMAIISEMAVSGDYQLWLTRVSEDEKVGIYIEDGEIKTAEVAESESN